MKNLERELLRQISLISYDRNKILSEQIVSTPDIFGRDKFLPQEVSKITNTDLDKNAQRIYLEDKKVAKKAFDKISYEIDGGWMPWYWGTDEDGITEAILSIQNKQQYEILTFLLSKKYPNFLMGGYTILGFIQQEEFSMAMKDEVRKDWLSFAKMSPETVLNPITLSQLHQYLANDRYLITMQNHLQKFNKKENFQTTKTSALTLLFPPQVSGVIHTILPIASFLLSEFPPAALAVELADAGLYAAEGDYYGTGIALVFCFIPGGPAFQWIKGYSKQELNVIIKKLATEAETGTAQEFTEREMKVINKIKTPRLQRLIKIEGIRRATYRLLEEIHSVGFVLRVVWWLVKKGYLAVKFLTEFGLQIGGAFFTWDFIASRLGICDNMNLKSLESMTDSYLKYIGTASKILQPFSNPCDKRTILSHFKTSIEKEVPTDKGNIIDYLKLIVKTNEVYSQSLFQNQKSIEVLVIQLALKNLGITHFEGLFEPKSNTEKKPTIDFKTNTGAGKYNDYDPSGGLGVARLKTPGLVATGNIKTDKQKSLKKELEPTKVEIKYKWYYYDTDTTNAVKVFQEKNGLTVDGQVGPKTAEKLIEKIKSLSSVDDYGQFNQKKLTPMKIEELLKNSIEVFKKQTEKWNDSFKDYETTPEQNRKTSKEIENNSIKKLDDEPYYVSEIKDDINSDTLDVKNYPK